MHSSVTLLSERSLPAKQQWKHWNVHTDTGTSKTEIKWFSYPIFINAVCTKIFKQHSPALNLRNRLCILHLPHISIHNRHTEHAQKLLVVRCSYLALCRARNCLLWGPILCSQQNKKQQKRKAIMEPKVRPNKTPYQKVELGIRFSLFSEQFLKSYFLVYFNMLLLIDWLIDW